MTSPFRGLRPLRVDDVRAGRFFDELLAGSTTRPPLRKPTPHDDLSGRYFDDLLKEPPPSLPPVTVTPPPPMPDFGDVSSRRSSLALTPDFGDVTSGRSSFGLPADFGDVEAGASSGMPIEEPWPGKPNELTLGPDESEFGRSLRQMLVGSGLSLEGRWVRALGETIDSPALFGMRQGIAGLGESMMQSGDARAATIAPPRVQTTDDIHSFEDLLDYIAQAAGQGVGSSIPSLVAAALTSGAGALPMLGAAFVPSLAQNYGGIERELEERAPEMDQGKLRAGALGTAVPVALVEALADRFLVGMFGDVLKPAVRGGALRRAGTSIAKGAGSEGATEFAQELIQLAGTDALVGKPTDADEARVRLREAGTQGAIAGGGMTAVPSAAGAVAETVQRRAEDALLERMGRDFDDLMARTARYDERLDAIAPDRGSDLEPRQVPFRDPEPETEREPASTTRLPVRDPIPDAEAVTFERPDVDRPLPDPPRRDEPPVQAEPPVSVAPEPIEAPPERPADAPVTAPEPAPQVEPATAPEAAYRAAHDAWEASLAPLTKNLTPRQRRNAEREETRLRDAVTAARRQLRESVGPEEADRIGREVARAFQDRKNAPPGRGEPTPQAPTPPATPAATPAAADDVPATIETRKGTLTLIGRNERGTPLYEDARGVRFLGDPRSEGLEPEPVSVSPSGPDMAATVARRRPRYEVATPVSSPLPDTGAPENNAVTSPSLGAIGTNSPKADAVVAAPAEDSPQAPGPPPVLYHGSPNAGITTFDRLAPRDLASKPNRVDSVGTWFAESPDEVQAFTRGFDAAGKATSGRVYRARVRITNPKVYESWGDLLDDFNRAAGRPEWVGQVRGDGPRGVAPDGGNRFHSWLKEQGYDGIKVTELTGIDRPGGPQTYWAALDPEQVAIDAPQQETPDVTLRPNESVPTDGEPGAVRPGVPGQPVPQPPGRVPGDAAVGAESGGRRDGDGGAGTVQGDNAVAVGDDVRPAPGARGEPGAGARSGGAEREGAGDGGPAGERDGGVAEADTAEADVDAAPAATNFVYTPELLAQLEEGGPVERLRRILTAIRLAKRINEEGRHATGEEQRILAMFAGWGAVRGAFDERDTSRNARDRRAQLIEEIGADDYAMARRATLDAHYTSPVVVQSLWRMAQRLGHRGGVVLEPSMGGGFFLGMAPQGVPTRWQGVELDPTTASIARLLYPQASIVAAGFETVDLPDNSVDLVIGNPPFGRLGVAESRKRVPPHLTRKIHDYFFMRALQATRPGGLVMFVTGDDTMDAPGSVAVRRTLAEQGDLVAAFRLPGDAFEKIANTRVTTDVIILQKRTPGEASDAETWADVVDYDQDDETFRVNEYFARHPERMLGRLETGGIGGRSDQRLVSGDRPLGELLAAMEGLLPTGIVPARQESTPRPAATRGPLAGAAKRRVGTYQVQGNAIVVQEADGSVTEVDIPKAHVARVRRYIAVRDARRAAVERQLDPQATDAQVADAIRALSDAYQAMVTADGPLSLETRSTRNTKTKEGEEEREYTNYPNMRHLDAEAPVVATLDSFDYDLWEAGDKTGAVKRSPMLSQRVLWPEGTEAARSITSDGDALAAVLSQRGFPDLDAIAALRHTTPEEVEQRLGDAIYRDPTTDVPVTRQLYLSGDVKTKLAVAVSAAKLAPKYERNVEALRAVQPTDIPLQDVSFRLGATWVPAETYAQFLQETFYPASRYAVPTVTLTPATGRYTIKWPNNSASQEAAFIRFGVPRLSGLGVVEKLMNGESLVVRFPKDDGGGVDVETTDAVKDRAAALQAHFVEWVLGDMQRVEAIEREYNDTANRHVVPDYDADHVTTPGIAQALADGKPFAWHRHQRAAIWRYVSGGSVLLQHPVGAGKTFEMAAMAMEARRLGLARKPLITYPNALAAQWPREFLELYPNARILAINPQDMKDAGTRQAFWARAQAGDWDAILVPESVFGFVQVGLEKQAAWIREELEQLEQTMADAAKASGRSSQTVRDLEKAKKKLEVELEQALKPDKKRRDAFVTWEELGIDLLIVDEVHRYKNGGVISANPNVKAERAPIAADFAMKARMVREVNPTHGLILASGTTIANNVAPELYHFMRVMDPQALADRGLTTFDRFINEFAAVNPSLEQKGNGEFQYVERVDKWVNLPELQKLMGQRWDVLLVDPDVTREVPPRGMIRLPRPPIRGGKPQVVETDLPPGLEGLMRDIVRLYDVILARMKRRDDLKGWPAIPNLAAVGEAGAIDMRLVDPSAQDHPASKLSVATGQILEEYHKFAPQRGVQLVFLNLQERDPKSEHLPRGVPGFDTHRELIRKLVEAGIPRAEIAVLNVNVKGQARSKIIREARLGRVRVVIGSTAQMGVGLNVQTRLTAMHHIDGEWRPADIEQRNGRGFRQGNVLWAQQLMDGVREFRYVTPSSYDAFRWSKVARKDAAIKALLTQGEKRELDAEQEDEHQLAMLQIQAVASGNPYLLEISKATLDVQAAERGVARERQEKVSRSRMAGSARLDLQRAKDRLEASQRDAALVPVDLGALPATVNKVTHPLGSAEAKEALTKELLQATQDLTRLNLRGVTDGRPLVRVPEFRIDVVRESGGFHLWMQPTADAEMGYEGTMWPADQTNGVDIVARVRNMLAKPAQVAQQAAQSVERLTLEVERLSGDTGVGKAQAALDAAREELARLKTALQAYQTAQGKPAPTTPEDDGIEERAAFMDPFTPIVAAGIKEVRKRLAASKARKASLYRATDPTVQGRWEMGRTGIRPESFREAWRRRIEQARRWTRSLPGVDPDASPTHAVINDLLLNQRAVREWARQMAYTRIQQITAGLTEAEEELLTWALRIQDDLRGIEGGARSSLGYADETAAREAERDIMAEVGKHARVGEALQRRQRMATDLTRELVEAGLLPPSVLDDSRYYHRQILDFYNLRHGRQSKVGGALRPRRYGFMKQRTWSDRVANNQYREAEFEWVAQAYARLQTDRTAEAIRSLADVREDLSAQAKAANEHRVLEVAAAAAGVTVADIRNDPKNNPYSPFRRRIARATGELYDLLERGAITLPAFDPLVDALARRVAGATTRAERARRLRDFAHPQWWPLLSTLAAQPDADPGTVQARTILKAIADRNAMEKETLAESYVTWEDLVPDDHVVYQVDPGHLWARGFGVVGELLDETEAVPASELSRVLIQVGKKPQWVIPEWLADALDEFKEVRPDEAEIPWLRVTKAWKWLKLQAPWRLPKYILNNTVGDLDAAILMPSALREIPSAAADLWEYMQHPERLSPGLRAELEEWMRLRVIGSGISVAEITDLRDEMRQAVALHPLDWMGWVTNYPTQARQFTQWRENILRLAVARAIERATKPVGYLASNPKKVDALEGRARTAQLSRDLIGDYGNVSHGGQWLRSRLLPFYSWMEINARRYYWLLRNARAEGRGVGKVAAAAATKGTVGSAAVVAGAFAGKVVAINALTALVSLWNHLMFPEDDEALRDEERGLYLIVGHDAEGNVLRLRTEGAWADFLSWVDLNDPLKDAEDLSEGRTTWQEQARDMAQAPLNRLAQSVHPAFKVPFEVLTERSIFPNAFDARPLRDAPREAWSAVELGWLYDQVTKKPQRQVSAGNAFSALFLYRTDPNEAAYYYLRDRVRTWQEARGTERPTIEPTDRSNALYYFRKASAWGDTASASHWLGEYIEEGGTMDGLKKGTKPRDPLNGLSKKDQRAFLAGLTPHEARAYAAALTYVQGARPTSRP